MGTGAVAAQENKNFEAKIVKVVEEKEIEVGGQRQKYQKLELKLTNGFNQGKTVIIENGHQPLANVVVYKEGDRVIVSMGEDLEGKEIYTIVDYVRKDGLVLLTIIFVALTLIVARLKGLMSILSMVFTFGVVFVYILPQLSLGKNPMLVAVLASVIIIPISFYMAHGVSQKTTVAVVSSLLSLGITAGLSLLFIRLGRLTGLASEEAGMLLIQRSGDFDMKGLLLSGIIIGALGVLDDITVAQAGVVNELIKSGEKTNKVKIYKQAMNVGRDHISSMVNTLVLAYAGASMPLLLIFVDNPHPWGEIINYEFLAEEIIRTMVGSIGLILAVPITTAIAVNWIKKEK
jgi:uncharacterized membrane protein